MRRSSSYNAVRAFAIVVAIVVAIVLVAWR